MKQGSWDPLENLPKEYANIYSFENLKNTQRLAIKKAHEEGMKISGNYVKISIKGFSKEDLTYVRNDTPLILSTLLEHERKLCIMHYKITLNYEDTNKLKGKQTLETQCGFRRILTKPIYSSEVSGSGINSDKYKFEKFLEKDKFYYASVYSQLNYPNSPVLFFDNDQGLNKNLVGSGDVVSTNSKKIILKRIILTGYPVKIKKRRPLLDICFSIQLMLIILNLFNLALKMA